MASPTISAQVEARLAPLLGPNMARSAVRTFTQQGLGMEPEALTADDVPNLLAALRPALRTLLGASTAEHLLEQLARELG